MGCDVYKEIVGGRMEAGGENECGGGETFKGDQGGWGSRGVLADEVVVTAFGL